jgi:hypothetical protein
MDNTVHTDRQIAAAEARHAGGSHELSDAERRLTRAKETQRLMAAVYKAACAEHTAAHVEGRARDIAAAAVAERKVGEDLLAAEAETRTARAAFVALGGEE